MKGTRQKGNSILHPSPVVTTNFSVSSSSTDSAWIFKISNWMGSKLKMGICGKKRFGLNNPSSYLIMSSSVMLKVRICVPLGPGQPGLHVFKCLSSLGSFRGYTEQWTSAKLGAGKEVTLQVVRTLVPLAGVAGEDGMDVQLWLL